MMTLFAAKIIRVSLTSDIRVLFKYLKFSNYFLKKSTITIFNAFNTQLL